jgi:NADPH2:quinone reductase
VELEPPTVDDTVLVPAAAGGLGWLLVQAAQAAGARVVAATRGEEKLARVKELGPDVLVDYGTDDWAEAVRREVDGVTLVYDGVGGDLGRTALELLSPGGRLVMFGYSAGSPTWFDTTDVVTRGISVSWSLGVRMLALPGGIPGLAGRALERHADGGWSPLVTTYPLAEAARAHADLEGRATMGKVVLLPG